MTQLIQPQRGEVVAQLNLRVPQEVKDWLKSYAGTKGQSVNTAINAIIRTQMVSEQEG